MQINPQLMRLSVILVAFHCGCSSNNQVGAPGRAGRGGAASADVAGLKLEVEPTGSDGGSVSIVSDENGAYRVLISGVEVIVRAQNDGLLEVTIDGKNYGQAKKGDRLRIDERREVFLNEQRIMSPSQG